MPSKSDCEGPVSSVHSGNWIRLEGGGINPVMRLLGSPSNILFDQKICPKLCDFEVMDISSIKIVNIGFPFYITRSFAMDLESEAVPSLPAVPHTQRVPLEKTPRYKADEPTRSSTISLLLLPRLQDGVGVHLVSALFLHGLLYRQIGLPATHQRKMWSGHHLFEI